ncbi:MAG: hypothetical protein KGP35_02795 [Bacteroidetes bacterium]|nr:hypothetical protein [Bacteroidota bacterium]
MKWRTLFNKLITNRYAIRFALIHLSILLITTDIFAQGAGFDPGGEPGGDPDLIPVDGGLGFLLAAGVGYGVKKAREYRRRKS